MNPINANIKPLQDNMLHAAYRIAHQDHDFMCSEELRGARLMLEYQKTEAALKENNVVSTVVVFGSARVLSPEQSELALLKAKTSAEKEEALLRAKQLPWYEMARAFGKIASLNGGALNSQPNTPLHNVIATGGGPGLMEAANRGAHDVGAPSIGFNIILEHEQFPNPYSTPQLTFLFKLFGIRKMHMALRSNGLAVMPGGFGTYDELFEIANLIACDKMPLIPIVLFDRKFWNSTCNFDVLVDEGLISKNALKLFSYADSAQEGWELMEERRKVIGQK